MSHSLGISAPVEEYLVQNLYKFLISAIPVDEFGGKKESSYDIRSGIPVIDKMAVPFIFAVRVSFSSESLVVQKIKELIDPLRKHRKLLIAADERKIICRHYIVLNRHDCAEHHGRQKHCCDFLYHFHIITSSFLKK